ncbi:MAG: excisionase family DNA-binding protein [Clostridiaceae bacterium]|nr:excisionase family DNA-binding protein [Clostridiaceae bacterium]
MSEHLCVSKDKIYRWVAKKKMPANKIGQLWKIKITQVDKWLDNARATLLIGYMNKVNVIDTDIVMSAQNEVELV